jgi:Uma2 family endonuclease
MMSAAPRFPQGLGYAGLRMTADEFLSLGETRDRYELIDGVVVMSPSAPPIHNEILLEIALQLRAFADRTGDTRVFPETDVRFAPERVYRPDISVYRASRLPARVERLDQAPDLVVEVLSAGTKALDLITKRDDYERYGVAEYWVADPDTGDVRCWQREGSRLAEAALGGDTLVSAAFAGLVLDLRPLRRIASRHRGDR